MIDWMNPSDDVLDARCIGYQEAMQECAENAEALRAEVAGAERVIQDLQSFAAKKDKRIEELKSANDKLLKDGWMEWKKAGKPGDWKESCDE